MHHPSGASPAPSRHSTPPPSHVGSPPRSPIASPPPSRHATPPLSHVGSPPRSRAATPTETTGHHVAPLSNPPPPPSLPPPSRSQSCAPSPDMQEGTSPQPASRCQTGKGGNEGPLPTESRSKRSKAAVAVPRPSRRKGAQPPPTPPAAMSSQTGRARPVKSQTMQTSTAVASSGAPAWFSSALTMLQTLGKCTGNPRVSRPLPVPEPVGTRTRDPTGLPAKMSPKTWKTVEKWVRYTQFR